jgi:predicted transcriptional regulator
MKKRDLKIGVKGWDESMQEAIEIGRRIDAGFVPERPVERVYFADFKTLLQYITPRRLDLLTILHGHGATSINALAKLLGRSYKNVYDDVQILERVGLIEKDTKGRISVPWDEIETRLSLAA